MTSMTTATVCVIGGVNTYEQSHYAAVIDGVGVSLTIASPDIAGRLWRLLEWLRSESRQMVTRPADSGPTPKPCRFRGQTFLNSVVHRWASRAREHPRAAPL
jgi:hypothetical protein